MLNIRALKDAVARWQTYEDRGIKPHYGWDSGGDGNSCALGDISHYENLLANSENSVGDYLGFERFILDKYYPMWVGDGWNVEKNTVYRQTTACLLSTINDYLQCWPIAEVQRVIDWEEALNRPLSYQYFTNALENNYVTV